VAVGWGGYLNPDCMIIADDEISSDKNEAELYLTGVPFECDGRSLSVIEGAAFVNSSKDQSFILVLKTLEDALNLYRAGCSYSRLNLGGLHYEDGRKEITRYLYLNEKDIGILSEINELGIEIFVQDLPSNQAYGFDYVLNKWKDQ
jgi:PTS system N-acetylgalactosamine-specific IIB component